MQKPHPTLFQGVEGALDAVPILHDESLAYLTAASLIADSNAALSLAATGAGAGVFNLTSWPGLSSAAALKGWAIKDDKGTSRPLDAPAASRPAARQRAAQS